MTLNKFYHSISTLSILFLHPSLLFLFSQVPFFKMMNIHQTIPPLFHHPPSTILLIPTPFTFPKMMDIPQKKTLLVKIIHLEKKIKYFIKMQLHLKRISLRNHAKRLTLFGRVNKTTTTRVFSKDLCEIGVTNRAHLTRDINQMKNFFLGKIVQKKPCSK